VCVKNNPTRFIGLEMSCKVWGENEAKQLDLFWCPHRAYLNTGFTLQTKIYINITSITDQAYGGCRTQVNTTTASHALVYINFNHKKISLNKKTAHYD
jgi:hypothetical protein